MNITKLLKSAEKLAIDNSPAILTAIGVTGTVATAYLTGKASIKAYEAILNEDAIRHDAGEPALEPKDAVKVVWKLYIPAFTTGFITIGAIFGANHVSTRRATAVATAYSLSERAFSEYKEKVVEKLGEGKERDLRDELAQERVDRNPMPEGAIVITGEDGVLCYDQYTGRYFKSTMETLKGAENEINHLILNQGYASLTDFFHEIGLERTGISDEVGWNTDQLLYLQVSTTMSADQRPCLAIDYNHRPVRNFDKFGYC